VHLVFNGHYLGVLVFVLYEQYVHGPLVAALERVGVADVLYANAAADWPVAAQILVALVVVDFVQWCVHNVLHRVSFLWEFHKVHHSVKDGEMDWIVSFRFHWMEIVVYKSFLYVPLAFFGFGTPAILFHAIFGTLIGHLNHANLSWDYGPLRYLLNNPKMHLWHHDYDGDERTTVNFGIIFSCWDYLFGTAKVPPHPPAHIGFEGVETMPDTFFEHAVWPVDLRRDGRARAVALGALLAVPIGLALLAIQPSVGGPGGASSRPSVVSLEEAINPPALATAALERFGEDAAERGYAAPDYMVSARELIAALGSSKLVLLDARPLERYALGHIPTAQPLDRGDYMQSAPVPGLSKAAPALEAVLAQAGVAEGKVVVIYGDGGPEPYRLWWTLHRAGLPARVLDGGLHAYKSFGRPTASGAPEAVEPGAVTLAAGATPRLWSEVAGWLEAHPGAARLDTRTPEEFTGETKRKNAARAGRIPGSQRFTWQSVLRSADDQRLVSRAKLREMFDARGLGQDRPIMTYCQSATRSAAVWFALLQAGHPESLLLNYDGSWAVYSRLDEPVETGTGDEG